MKRLRAILVVCLVGFPSSVFAFDAYVASFGSDTNGCTRSSPCATFAGAFSVLLARSLIFRLPDGGTIHVIDAGAYGRLTITRSVTLDGGGFGTTLSSD